MDHRKEYLNSLLSKNINSIFRLETVKNVITKPWKIPSALMGIYRNFRDFNNDIKLKPLSINYLLKTVDGSIDALAVLAVEMSNSKESVNTMAAYFGKNAPLDEDCIKLASFFNSYGSDKASIHDYYIAYATLLKSKKNEPLNILEVGLGTNNIDVLSNMGTLGKPGASLRAFRDMYKNSNIYGADIDKRILFTEDRIKTFFVDQTDPATFNELKIQLNEALFDLIIDDGLHNSQANLNTTNFALSLLKPDGVFIIEDININDFKFFQIVEAILKQSFSVDFIETKSKACICIIKKK